MSLHDRLEPANVGRIEAEARRKPGRALDWTATNHACGPGADCPSPGSTAMATEVPEGRLDLAFVGLPGDPPPGIKLIPITCEPIMLAVAAEHPLAQRRSVGLAALTEETLVDLPAGWGTRMAVDRSFTAAGVARAITYEVNDTATMVELIRNKLAVGMLPASFVDTADDIALIPIRNHPPQFQTAIAIPANRRLSASTRAMLDTIERHTHT